MKYIVKNCPAYYYDEKFNYHICKQPLVSYEGNVDYCLNCSDCIIKQIVGLCKEKTKICKDCSKTADINIDCVECDEKGEANLSQAIVNLLENEEVDE